jgi:predicted ArsR family transcriptional regulator
VEDLSRALGVSTVAVRQHLEALEAEGLISSRSERRPIGRPRRLFHLTEAADDLFPQSYGGLAQVILEHLESTGGEELIDEVFRARRMRTEAELRPRVEGKDLAGRIEVLAAAQDDAGYMADWEQEPDGSFLLQEHNCAICKIARRFPQVCDSELELIRNLTGAEVSRERHLARGDSNCAYRIRRSEPE